LVVVGNIYFPYISVACTRSHQDKAIAEIETRQDGPLM